MGSLYYPQQPVAFQTNKHDVIAQSYNHTLIAYENYKSTTPGKCAALQLYRRGGIGDMGMITTTAAVTLQDLSPYQNTTAHVGLGEAASLYDYGTYANGHGMIATTLERSDLFNLSGVPINNSRVLAIRATFNDDQTPRTCTTYLKYVRLARVFMNNVEVEQ